MMAPQVIRPVVRGLLSYTELEESLPQIPVDYQGMSCQLVHSQTVRVIRQVRDLKNEEIIPLLGEIRGLRFNLIGVRSRFVQRGEERRRRHQRALFVFSGLQSMERSTRTLMALGNAGNGLSKVACRIVRGMSCLIGRVVVGTPPLFNGELESAYQAFLDRHILVLERLAFDVSLANSMLITRTILRAHHK